MIENYDEVYLEAKKKRIPVWQLASFPRLGQNESCLTFLRSAWELVRAEMGRHYLTAQWPKQEVGTCQAYPHKQQRVMS